MLTPDEIREIRTRHNISATMSRMSAKKAEIDSVDMVDWYAKDVERLLAHIDELNKILEANNWIAKKATEYVKSEKKLPCGHPMQCLIPSPIPKGCIGLTEPTRPKVCGWCEDMKGGK